MALRSGNPFYFLFSPESQDVIDPSTIVITDVPYSANPLVSAPYPQALRIQFSLKKDAKTAPKLRPLGPGLLTFHFDPEPGKTPPTPPEAIIENYDKWPTVGRLRLNIHDDKVIARIKAISGLPVAPSDIWYSNVRLTKNFLFQSLPKLPVKKVIAGGKESFPPDTPDGLKQAVSGILNGKYYARLISGRIASGDSQSAVEMPELAETGTGTYDFYITTGFARAAFDGEEKNYENPNAVTDNWEPAHPRNGIIPARLVYRNLRLHSTGDMIDGDLGRPVPDAILASSGANAVPDYYAVRFTRIWKPQEEFSIHCPSQVVTATHLATGTQIQQRLAAHGILFLALTQSERQGGTDFSITLTNPTQRRRHEMTWLKADVPDVWKLPGATTAVTVTPPMANQAPQDFPHIVLRRRMAQEIIYDRKSRPTGFGRACTFFSLRRTVRALVNNRIAGGRLNFEVYYDRKNRRIGKNSDETRELVKAVLGTQAAKVLDGEPYHRAGEFQPHGSPAQDHEIGEQALKCRDVLAALFADLIQPQPGNPSHSIAKGKAAYLVWQSTYDQFESTSTSDFFTDKWLAGGGAGAVIAMDLVNGYTVRPGNNPEDTIARNNGETDQSFQDRIVKAMLAGNLKAGATLQFWDRFVDLDAIRARAVPIPPDPPLGLAAQGHSPIFLEYIGPPSSPTGIVVLDQTGETHCDRTGNGGAFILPWYAHNPEAWIATNWTE